MIKLGERERCVVTGFSGIATQRQEVLHGSTRYLVEGHDNTYRRDEWIEEGRLQVCDEKAATSVTTIPAARPRP